MPKVCACITDWTCFIPWISMSGIRLIATAYESFWETDGNIRCKAHNSGNTYNNSGQFKAGIIANESEHKIKNAINYLYIHISESFIAMQRGCGHMMSSIVIRKLNCSILMPY